MADRDILEPQADAVLPIGDVLTPVCWTFAAEELADVELVQWVVSTNVDPAEIDDWLEFGDTGLRAPGDDWLRDGSVDLWPARLRVAPATTYYVHHRSQTTGGGLLDWSTVEIVTGPGLTAARWRESL